MSQLGWKVDINSCVGCRACEMACKVEFDLKAGQGRRRKVIERTVVEGSTVRTFFISMTCNQCENPACRAACPVSSNTGVGGYAGNALYKDNAHATAPGVVLVNASKCIGCRRCEWACPYGAPQYNPSTSKIHKCEMCHGRRASTTLHASRKHGACVCTCLGQSIKQASVETDPALGNNRNTVDDVGGTVSYSDGPNFAAPGSTGDGYNDRGTQYIADASLTKPALKVRNRVYVNRDGSGLS